MRLARELRSREQALAEAKTLSLGAGPWRVEHHGVIASKLP
jgi:hypothetical protein